MYVLDFTKNYRGELYFKWYKNYPETNQILCVTDVFLFSDKCLSEMIRKSK